MKSVDQTLPNDAESLVKIVLSQRQALAEKEAKIDHQTDYIKQLIEAIQLAKHQHFGARSEKFNVDQLSWLCCLKLLLYCIFNQYKLRGYYEYSNI